MSIGILPMELRGLIHGKLSEEDRQFIRSVDKISSRTRRWHGVGTHPSTWALGRDTDTGRECKLTVFAARSKWLRTCHQTAVVMETNNSGQQDILIQRSKELRDMTQTWPRGHVCLLPDLRAGMDLLRLRLHEPWRVTPDHFVAFPESRDILEIQLQSLKEYTPHMQRINIPDGVTTIPRNMFHNQAGLIQVTLPSSVENIGIKAFHSCGLREIDLQGVLWVDESAFENCTVLSRATLKVVEKIGMYAFSGCVGLKEVVLPSSLLEISGHAFIDCMELVEVTLPSSLEKIGDYAFHNCGLIDVCVPGGVEEIGHYAFSYCSRLSKVTLSDGVKGTGVSAFMGCIRLVEVIISGDTCVGNHTFEDCTSLTKVNMSEVYEIGYEAFKGCISLTEVTMTGAIRISNSAFEGCASLTEVTMTGAIRICNSAFEGCASLTKVSMPAASEIGSSAFEGCTSLIEVTMTAAIRIGNSAFEGCVSLIKVSMPAASEIGSSAFEGCTSLTEAKMPGATWIGHGAFHGCTSLTEVSMPHCENEW